MIIVPTEKHFDWKHAPLVLFLLVIFNVLIFFLYQSADEEKITQALDTYVERDYLQVEWPLYKKYLTLQGEYKKLSEYKKLYKQHDTYNLSFYLLSDKNFDDYLSRYHDEIAKKTHLELWKKNRREVLNNIRDISFINYGLSVEDPHLLHFFTHQFLHGDVMHLLGNLFFLIICGFAVEAAIGHLRFLIFYLISGVAGGLLHVMSSDGSHLVGASGAISGVMAMYLAIFRFKKIEFFYWFFVFVGYFRAPALLILPFYIGKEIINFYTDTQSNVAYMAHIGGFIAGIGLMLIGWLFNPKMLNHEYIEEDQKSDPMREKLARVYDYIEKYRFGSASKLLDELINEFGLNFELAFLRYQLLIPEKNRAYVNAVLALLKMEKIMPEEIKKLEKVWRDNTMLHKLVKDDTLQKLGWRFAELQDTTIAEEIFEKLNSNGYEKSSLAAFANKLATTYANRNNTKKQKYYQALAENLL